METKGINELKKVLEKHNGEDAVISISHKLYGNEKKIKCKLDYFLDERRIGLRVKNGQELYIYNNELQDYETNDNIFFEDDVMRIDIKLK